MSAVSVVIYVAPYCPYCDRALQLLDTKQIDYTVIDVGGDSEKRAKMRELAGGRNSVPQIFIDDKHVGGCDDLMALEEARKLDAMIAGN